MSPDERELLQRAVTLASENNQILRGLRSSQRWQSFWSVIKWTLIIGSTLGAYYYLQPYLTKVLQLYQNLPDFKINLPR